MMAALAEGGQDHGALVQQILETQKELEDVNKRQQQKTTIEIVTINHLLFYRLFFTDFLNLQP
jgi:hypothetical protein